MEWHQQDPVDDFEMDRNEVIYGYQGNRNPFIDHPEFVEDIWGDPTNINHSLELSVSCYPNPCLNHVFVNHSYPLELNYSMVNLNGNKVDEGMLNTGKNMINLTDKKEGLYILILRNESGVIQKQYKFLKLNN
jgi:hypothetical protein